jgi:hypothetical protein
VTASISAPEMEPEKKFEKIRIGAKNFSGSERSWSRSPKHKMRKIRTQSFNEKFGAVKFEAGAKKNFMSKPGNLKSEGQNIAGHPIKF